MDIYCSKCGKQIHEKAKFCPYCGEPVLINRDLPDEDAVNEIVEPKVEEEVIEETPTQESYQRPRVDDQLINQYRREIDECRRKRKGMVTAGIILAAIFVILAIVFIVLVGIRSYEVAYAATKAGEDPYVAVNKDNLINSYSTLASLSGVGVNIGAVLIVLGAVVNGVKIKNRERIIKENENK